MSTRNRAPVLISLIVLIAATCLMLAACGGGSDNATVDNLSGNEGSRSLAVAEMVDTLEKPDGVAEDVFAMLKDELVRQLSAADLSRTASAAPTGDGAASRLGLDNSTGELSWRMYNPGDYDQNGEVGITDLTPLSVHFGKSGDFEPNSIEAVVDGDSNGEIGIADITPIAANFGVKISGFNIYSSTSYLDVPQENDMDNGATAQLVDNVGIGSAMGSPANERVYFTYTLPSVPANTYYWVRPTDNTTDGTPSNTTVPEGDTLTPEGGAVELDDIIFSIPTDGLVADVTFSHAEVPPPSGFPSSFTPVGMAHDINADHPEWLNAPVVVVIPYDDTGMTAEEENNLVALHFDGTEYTPVTILDQDTAANSITIDTRDFSVFTLGTIAQAIIDALLNSHAVDFAPGDDGWQINNFGSYFSPGGNCLGMSGYAVWFWNNRAENLWGKYSDAGGNPTSIAHLTATRAHIAQSQYWAKKFFKYEQKLGETKTGNLIKYFIKEFDTPLVFLMTGTGGHATVVYGWDAAGFRFYDVNSAGNEQHVTWNPTDGFGNYGGFSKFGYVAIPSLGRPDDFADLTTQAEGGFAQSGDINLTSPGVGEEINDREVQLAGTLSGSLNTAVQIVCYVKGVPITIPVSGGSFNATIPISDGENTLVILAGVNSANQSNWYKNGATLIRNVEGTAGESDLLVTLTWNQNDSDVDLYVTEPGGETSWYSSQFTSNGMELDFDNTSGYGPEHVTLNSEEGDTILPGQYTVSVHYFSDDGGGAVSGNVSIVIDEGDPNQQFYNFPFAIGTDNPDNDTPGSSGPDWVNIATVTLANP